MIYSRKCRLLERKLFPYQSAKGLSSFYALCYGMCHKINFIPATWFTSLQFLELFQTKQKVINYTLILTGEVTDVSDLCIQTGEALNIFNIVQSFKML